MGPDVLSGPIVRITRRSCVPNWGTVTRRPSTVRRRSSAELVEGLDKILGDILSGPPFDLPALEHVHELSVLQQADGWRRWRVAGEVIACALGRVHVLTSEDRGQVRGLRLVSERERHRGTRIARGAAADRVHDDECRARGVLERAIDLFRRAQLLEPDSCQLLTHRRYHAFVVNRLMLWKTHNDSETSLRLRRDPSTVDGRPLTVTVHRARRVQGRGLPPEGRRDTDRPRT